MYINRIAVINPLPLGDSWPSKFFLGIFVKVSFTPWCHTGQPTWSYCSSYRIHGLDSTFGDTNLHPLRFSIFDWLNLLEDAEIPIGTIKLWVVGHIQKSYVILHSVLKPLLNDYQMCIPFRFRPYVLPWKIISSSIFFFFTPTECTVPLWAWSFW